MHLEGSLNSWQYIATCEKQQVMKNYQKAIEIGDDEGNIGNYFIELYHVSLSVTKDSYTRKVNYMKTITKKVQ
jgi:hypothetical protein